MRGIVFVIPFFIALYYVLRGRQDLAFLNAYLPCLILSPDYYVFKVPHLPPIPAASWALIPLALSLFVYPLPRLQLRRLDLWVVLFAVSFGMSEVLREPNPKDGFILWLSWVTTVLFAYVVGRRVIEPALRVATVQRIILLFVLLTPLILWEVVIRNPWMMMASHFHLDIPAGNSIRNGRVRLQASFAHAILAGIMFFIAFMLNYYLADIYKRDKSRLTRITRWLEHYHIPAVLLLVFLWLTQSRGPMIAAVVGYSLLQIPKFRHQKVAAFVIALLLGLGGLGVTSYLNRYTNVVDTGDLNEEQTSAMYRRELIKNYTPIAEQGGWLGWGSFGVPMVEGQKSIDNGYLVIQLVQGKFGFYVFLLIIADGVGGTAYRAFSFQYRESRMFAFTLLAATAGLFLSLTAVYLGPSVAPTCFLLLGWTQSVEDEVVPVPKFIFKRRFA